MQVLIILAAAIVVLVFIAKLFSAKPPTPEQLNQYTEEQLWGRRKQLASRLSKLSTESVKIALNLRATNADMKRHEKLEEEIAVLEKEEELIRAKLSTMKKKELIKIKPSEMNFAATQLRERLIK